MWNYPDGMTDADFRYLDGVPSWFEYFMEEVAPEYEWTDSLYEDFQRWARRAEDPDEHLWWEQYDKSQLTLIDEGEAA